MESYEIRHLNNGSHLKKLFFILLNFESLKLSVNSEPPVSPHNGQLYVFDKDITRNFKADEVNWAKKKNTNRIQVVKTKYNSYSIFHDTTIKCLIVGSL